MDESLKHIVALESALFSKENAVRKGFPTAQFYMCVGENPQQAVGYRLSVRPELVEG